MAPLKVVYLIPTLDIGGAEIDLVRVLPRIDRGFRKDRTSKTNL